MRALAVLRDIGNLQADAYQLQHSKLRKLTRRMQAHATYGDD